MGKPPTCLIKCGFPVAFGTTFMQQRSAKASRSRLARAML